MFNLQIGQKSTDWVAIIEAAASFAWPVAFVIAIILLRKEVRVILPRLRSIKGWGIDAQLDQLEQQVEKIEPELTPELEQATEARPRTAPPLAPQISPIGLALLAWNDLSQACYESIVKLNPETPGNINSNTAPSMLVNHLQKLGIFNSEMMQVFRSLRDIRNQLVHMRQSAYNFDDEQAQRFYYSASSLTALVRQRTNERQASKSASSPDL